MGLFKGFFRSEPVPEQPEVEEVAYGYMDGILEERIKTEDGLSEVLKIQVYQALPQLIPSSKVTDRLKVYLYIGPGEYDQSVTNDRICRFAKVRSLDDNYAIFGTETGAKYYESKKSEESLVESEESKDDRTAT